MSVNGKKILIVEDDKDFLSILGKKLTTEGFSVVLAENGLEGLRAAEEKKPDLIFTDVLLPKMNGIEMAKAIRRSGKEIPIIFLTNIKEGDYSEEIKKSNFECIIKSDLGIGDIVRIAKEKLP